MSDEGSMGRIITIEVTGTIRFRRLYVTQIAVYYIEIPESLLYNRLIEFLQKRRFQ